LSLPVDLRDEAGQWPLVEVNRSLDRKIVIDAFGSTAGVGTLRELTLAPSFVAANPDMR